jgi:hypothetical protein
MWAVSQEIYSPLWLLCKKVHSWSKSKDGNHGIKQKVQLRNKFITKSPYDISLQASVNYTEPKAWNNKKEWWQGILTKLVLHERNRGKNSEAPTQQNKTFCSLCLYIDTQHLTVNHTIGFFYWRDKQRTTMPEFDCLKEASYHDHHIIILT